MPRTARHGSSCQLTSISFEYVLVMCGLFNFIAGVNIPLSGDHSSVVIIISRNVSLELRPFRFPIDLSESNTNFLTLSSDAQVKWVPLLGSPAALR